MTIQKSFLFNTLFTLAVNLLVKPVWVFGVDRTVQNRLGEAEYGMYFAIFNFTYLFQIILDFGLQNYNQTEIAADPSRIKKLFPGLLFVKMLLSAAYFLIVMAAGIMMGYAWESFFFWLLINQVLLSLNIFLRSNISANRLFLQDALLSVMDKLIMIAGATILLLGLFPSLELTIKNFVLIQTAALGATTIVCLLLILRIQLVFDWKPDLSTWRTILKDSLPFATAYFLMTVYYRLDSVMIEQMLGEAGAAEAGIYAQSYRIMESVNNIGYLLAGVLLPLFAYRIGQGESYQEELKHGFGIMLTLALPIIIGGVTYAQDIIGSLYPDRDPQYSARIFILLLLNFFPVAMLYVISPLLTANKSFKWMLSSLVVAVALNIGLNAWLIPERGALGAAIATLITQLLMLISYSFGLIRIFNIQFSVKFFVPGIYLLLFNILLALVNSSVGLHWLPGLAITGILSLLAAWRLGVVSKESWRLKID
jgi:O-antigen/teichoic acid export membrane protein